MPLIKETLATGIKNKIKLLEPKLIQKLDGGKLSNQIGNANTISDALDNIKIKCQALGQLGSYDETIIKQITSNEWANAIAKQVISLLAEDVSKIVSDEIDKFIKSATIIVPPGQAVYAGSVAGATSSPAPPATIS